MEELSVVVPQRGDGGGASGAAPHKLSLSDGGLSSQEPLLTKSVSRANVAWSRCGIFGLVVFSWLAGVLFLILGDVNTARKADVGLYGYSVQLAEKRVYGRPMNEYEQAVADKERWNTVVDLSGRYIPFFIDYVTTGRFNFAGIDEVRNLPTVKFLPDCTKHYFDLVVAQLVNETTRPSEVRSIVSSFSLADFPPAERVLGDLLHHPQPIQETVDAMYACAVKNRPLKAFLCALQSNPSLPSALGVATSTGVRDATSIEARGIARRVITFIVVIDKLIVAARESDALFADMYYHVVDKFMGAGGTNQYNSKNTGAPRTTRFVVDKFNSVEAAVAMLAKLRTGSALAAGDLAAFERLVQLNILEAGKSEVEIADHTENANVALILSHFLLNRGSMIHLYVDKVNYNRRVLWNVRQDFIDLYIAWNAAYVANIPSSMIPIFWSVLVAPSVMCSQDGAESGGQEFMTTRALSLFLALVSLASPDRIDVGGFPSTTNFTRLFGESNLANSFGLRLPTPDDAMDMLNLFPVPLSSSYVLLSPKMWSMLVVVSMWVSICIVGFGSEYLGMRYLAMCNLSRGNIDLLSSAWFYVQLLFPLCTAIGMYSYSIFGAPFVALGLWKFGFPETLSALARSLTSRTYNGEHVRIMRAFFSFLNGFGLILHHSATAWAICTLLLGYVVPSRWVLAVCQPLILQHWIVPLKYVNYLVYGILSIVIEVLWEREVFGNLRYFTERHLQCVAWTMLISHWCFLVSGIGGFFYENFVSNMELKVISQVDQTRCHAFTQICRVSVRFDAEVSEFVDASRSFIARNGPPTLNPKESFRRATWSFYASKVTVKDGTSSSLWSLSSLRGIFSNRIARKQIVPLKP